MPQCVSDQSRDQCIPQVQEHLPSSPVSWHSPLQGTATTRGGDTPRDTGRWLASKGPGGPGAGARGPGARAGHSMGARGAMATHSKIGGASQGAGGPGMGAGRGANRPWLVGAPGARRGGGVELAKEHRGRARDMDRDRDRDKDRAMATLGARPVTRGDP